MRNLQWGNGRARPPKTSSASPPDKTGRVARAINWQISHDRSKTSTAAREAHLRSLMRRSTMLDDDGSA
jgi:hypothetical protein